MKFFRYKQVARLNFSGVDDELNNVASSYYNSKFKLFNNTEINTKLLRFRINNLRDIKLSQNAKLILESIYLPCIIDNNLDIKHNSNIIVRLKNISDSNCFDSSNDNNSAPIIFSHSVQSRPQTFVSTVNTTLNGPLNTYVNNIANTNKFDNGISFHNPSPDKLYNFTIPNTRPIISLLHSDSFILPSKVLVLVNAAYISINFSCHLVHFHCCNI